MTRDARMILESLGGRHPSPIIDREMGRPRRGAVEVGRALRVARIERETADAVSVHLEDPTGAPIRHLPGQFLTLVMRIGPAEVRRSYSISSAPGGATAVITVKRQPGGMVSSYINNVATAGAVVRVLGPQGSFTVTPDPAAERRIVAIAAGSGITPIMGITRAVLAAEPRSRVTLIYNNRRLEDVIFRAALERLREQHPERFTLRHVLSQPPPAWAEGKGHLDRATLAAELDRLPPAGGEVEYFICGPAPVMAAADEELRARGVPAARIHHERFTRVETGVVVGPQRVTVRRAGGGEQSLVTRRGETVLEAATRAGVELPSSCQMGGCGACKVKLVAGRVEMESPNCLSPAEEASGEVLTCVGRATEPTTLEVP